ncbi:hypothetical protein HNR46_002788 [Haloferula luteola]|uniref:Uncharacterized protein n=1 Tax=Haloferula luteola TaxID=595692 RepID=A0A840V3I4_9BACT|nr:hypothetical protein [Haloferula luteola]MBB5352542.1 hypothetical protein [Haloferula luteola]
MMTIVKRWSAGVGAMDALTGLMLVFWPGWVLSLLGIGEVGPESWVWVRWIGVFVGSVGFSYGWVWRGAREAEAVWGWTAMVRAWVAVFVTVNVLSGRLETAWVGVAATDGVVGIVQFYGIRKRWCR